MDTIDSSRRVVKNVATHFDVTPDVVEGYVNQSRHTLDGNSRFIDPTVQRYILIAVDPAGGGLLSDEALVVFLIANDRFGLFTGCLLEAHHINISFSVVPTVFLLGLLTMVRSVKASLRQLHHDAGFPTASFIMPPVLVLLENNFAYGAAIYLRLLYFIEEKRLEHPELKDVDISFATPVYGVDEQLVQIFLDRRTKQSKKHTLEEELQRVIEWTNATWHEYKRTRGLNIADIKRKVNDRLKAVGVDIDRQPTIIGQISNMV
jgi:hypothetical protein